MARQAGEEIGGLTTEEVQVIQTGPVALALRALDPVPANIHPGAKRTGRGGILAQKMAMAGAELEHDRDRTRKGGPQLGGQSGPPGAQQDLVLARPARQKPFVSTHLSNTHEDDAAGALPFPAWMRIIRMWISAGVTPLMREAWPRVNGRISFSFRAHSRLRPRTAA